MSLIRFENIKRFLKIKNGRTEPSDMGKGPDCVIWMALEGYVIAYGGCGIN